MKGLLLSALLVFGAASIQAETLRDVSQFNLLEGNIGFKAFDPVSTHPEGGEEALEGSEAIQVTHENVTYLFSSEAMKEKFLENPSLYEPTYGGWCAWAMAKGAQIDIDPQYAIIENGRSHYFVNARAMRNFARNIPRNEADADANWAEFLNGTR